MSYINGKEILPENILAEIQKYFTGGLIYIPAPKEERCQWGSKTNTKKELHNRNQEIRQKKKMGLTLPY